MVDVKFTDAYVKNLKPQAQRFDVRDSSGLTLRVTPDGTKTWTYVYKFEGKMRRVTFGAYPAVLLAEARKRHAEALGAKNLGKDPALKDYNAKGTVKQLAEEFHTRYLLKERKRPDIPKQILDADILPALGHKKLLDIKHHQGPGPHR